MLQMTGVILAGGQSRRMMGQNKAFLQLGGQSIIHRIVGVLRTVFSQVLIVANAVEDYQSLGCRVVSDLPLARGALTGLFSGLSYSSTDYNFFVACDMPFLQNDMIHYLASQAEGWDVLIPRIQHYYEPLHAVYSKDCLPSIVRQLKGGTQTIFDFFPEVKVKEVSEEDIRRIDPDLISFFNINTPQDLKSAQDIHERESSATH